MPFFLMSMLRILNSGRCVVNKTRLNINANAVLVPLYLKTPLQDR
jgi:hypothetical protein